MIKIQLDPKYLLLQFLCALIPAWHGILQSNQRNNHITNFSSHTAMNIKCNTEGMTQFWYNNIYGCLMTHNVLWKV